MSEPVVIVGAGVAGLATALAAAPRRVLLVSRDAGGAGSASGLAQGGLAAAIAAGDSCEAHAADTLAAGALRNDEARVRWLCAQAPEVVAWLQAQGVVFDRDAGGRLQLGREGGHGAARIVHAGGDATGAALVHALAARARAARHIDWQGGLEVDALLLRGDRVCGLRTRGADGACQELPAGAVVLATGGLGALFARTSNPLGANGAGLALALTAGAAMRDLEFIQFHPTALDLPGVVSLPLVTEALRGAGARIIDETGRRLLDGVHPQADLAPRDVVARTVWQAQQEGRRVLLDATGRDIDWPRRFPTVLAACRAHGIDPLAQAVPVTPAVHFHMGGIAVDADGRSSLPGLYAVGEVACTGVHGANRLASNSLLEGIAFGRRLGALLAVAALPATPGRAIWRELGSELAAQPLADLRQLLWNAAGPVRAPAALRNALHQAIAWTPQGWQARLAVALLAAMLRRRQRLGAHWRTDARELPAPRMPRAAAT
ncbi:L-aspartate oxidase [Dokdonella sp.]|uniref:L-aspartate oxidase n=1 Tax=Dokdonella sp. TaxID=2291710 RepID=UPI0031BE6509|nr:FAD-dependent oxidoreductase [Dokdonella sp.]